MRVPARDYRTPSWVFKGATLDLDFARGRGWSKTGGSLRSLLTTTRASDGYVENVSGIWTLVPSGVPRITDKGLLVEEARTNSIRNNSMQGASAPSTFPTNWSFSTGGSATATIIGAGTENGIDYLDVRIQGAGASDTWDIITDATTAIVATDTQTWTGSVFVRLVGGSFAGLSPVTRVTFRTAAGAGVASQSIVFSATAAALGGQRKTNTFLASGGTIARVSFQLNSATPTGAFDITLRIGWPQLELGAFASSPIRTTSAAATRAADGIAANNFASWFNAAEGTIYAEAVIPFLGGAGFPSLVSFDDTTVANAMELSIWDYSADAKRWAGYNGGVAQWNISPAAYSAGAVVKGAGAYKANDFQAAFDGALGTPDTSGTVPSVTRMNLGQNRGGGNQPNGYLRRVAYFPTRLANAQLQALTQ